LRRSAAPPSLAEQPRCSLDGRRAAAAPPTALSSTSHTGKPAALDVERPGARLRRSAAPPSLAARPRWSLDGRRAAPAPPAGLAAGAPAAARPPRGPLGDGPHREPRAPPPRRARPPATALGRATLPRRAAPVFPRRAPSGCSATNGPLVDESHRKTRRPRRRAARRAATALGRATLPRRASPVFPRRAPSSCTATNSPLVD